MKLSVIVPVYNQPVLVRRALDSIPYDEDLEVIVVNDASTDSTLDVLKEYGDRIRLIDLKENGGTNNARNIALDHCQGEYVIGLDDDDYFITEEFRRAIRELDGTDMVFINQEINGGHVFELCEDNKHHYCAFWTKFIRRELIGATRCPLDETHRLDGDRVFNDELMKKPHTEKYTGIIAYHYDFPRQGSQLWKRDHMGNIFYFKRICAIGGTEQFLYEIAKKYSDLDITIYYDAADPLQLKRLRKYVRCRRRTPGETVKCRYAFFNFNIDMIDDVEAERYYFVSHAIYQELGYRPPIEHPRLTHFIGVSRYSKEKIEEYGRIIGRDVKAECCYNPLNMEEPKKVIRLISATRLDDRTKGGQRTLALIDALDEYARKNDRQYLWLIFTNQSQLRISSPNVVLMERRVDIRPYIADSDYLVQLSNDMETYCYSINEALCYGVPVVTTPLTVLEEFDITDDMCIECDWDMANAKDVARQIFEKKRKKFTYTPPEDRWRQILSDEPSTYSMEDNTVRIRATDQWQQKKILDKDTMLIPEQGEEWTVELERYEELLRFEELNSIHLIDKV